jgi:tetratricopeptide (TPR) repeat protein
MRKPTQTNLFLDPNKIRNMNYHILGAFAHIKLPKPGILKGVMALLFVQLILGFAQCKSDATKPAAAAQAAALSGNVDPEVFIYSEKIKGNPNEDSLYYYRANAYYKSEGYDEAISDLQTAIRLDTTHPEYFHLLADCYLDYFKSYPAIQTMEEAKRRWPDRIPTLLKLSEFYLIVKKHGQAFETVQEIMKRDPQNSEGFFMAGMIAKDKNETALAIKNMERSVAVNPQNTDAWIILGNLLSGKNDQIALKYYQNALRIDSTSLEALDGIATFYHKAGRIAEAEAAYKDIVVKDPSRPETYFDLGLLYSEQNKYDAAKQHFDLAIDHDPIYFAAYYFRGLVHEEQDNLEAARSDFDQASRMATDYKEAIDALARVESNIKLKQK